MQSEEPGPGPGSRGQIAGKPAAASPPPPSTPEGPWLVGCGTHTGRLAEPLTSNANLYVTLLQGNGKIQT